MNKLVRTAAAAALAVIGVTAFSAGSASANASIDIAFTVGTSSAALPVGATNVPMTITITNNNTGQEHATIPNTICASNTGAPCPNDPIAGITFIPACADLILGAASRCTAGESDVFKLSSTATASSPNTAANSCNGRPFEVTLVDKALALYHVYPKDQNPVVLAGGETCTLTFSGSVQNRPLKDQDPLVPGIQTGQYAHVDARLNGQNLLASDSNTDQKTITVAQPLLKTTALPTVVLGAGSITDTATITGRIEPTDEGTITFKLYPPTDSTCSAAPIATYENMKVPATVNQVTSPGYPPEMVGTYRWVASYSGDRNNLPATGACNDANELSTVTIAKPVLTTAASPGVAAHTGTLTDTATLTKNGKLLPESKVTFRLYGPDDATCSKPPVHIDADRTFAPNATSITSSGYTPPAPGVYRWVAQYSGDANNTGTIGTCGDPLETVTVGKAVPKIVTKATPTAVVTVGQLTDTAEVLGGTSNITGTVTFRLYGPNDATCTGTPAFTDEIGFTGGAVTSKQFTPQLAGTYRWVATYSGDANNASAVGVCGDPAEISQVTSPTPPKLPETGSDTTWQALLAGFITVVGVGMVFASQRRTRTSI